MMTISGTLFAALLSLTAFNASDPDVRPDTLDPKVRVTVEEATLGSEESSTTANGANSGSKPAECELDMTDPQNPCGLLPFYEAPSDVETNVSPGDIRRAIREIPMPPLKLHVQPDGGTLVNVDTIFYTEPTTMRRTVALLGHSVRLECTPVRYMWVHGDGTTASTGKPGRPYPAKDVTHRYQRPGNDLRARVDTTYSVRYSVDGGRWTDLAEPLTAPGPSTAIDVDEAVPVLTH
jgi:hypothetical protein